MNHQRIIVRSKGLKSKKVLYLMTKAFRVNDNHTLEYAKNLTSKSLLSIYLFRVEEDNQRNNDFFDKGISNYQEALSVFTDDLRMFKNTFDTSLLSKFDCVISDNPYLQEDKAFSHKIETYCKSSNIGYYTVETNVVVPVHIVSDKEEYSARTIRKKIWTYFGDYLDLFTSYERTLLYEQEALDILQDFAKDKLALYHLRNHPEKDYNSNLSKYLKYGFISPLTIYHFIWGQPSSNVDEFLEELIVRRDLAYNYVNYNLGYNQFNHMTYPWAYQTMEVHELDHREYLYEIGDYLTMSTHDPYFNAAMKEMIFFGTMKGYMRMYWAKKIIEWSKTYEEAYQITIYLNNHYFYDGNTPNGYTGVAWCFGKHDRAWTERPIFGKLRYMNLNGLKRKFDIEKYVLNIEQKVRGLNE